MFYLGSLYLGGDKNIYNKHVDLMCPKPSPKGMRSVGAISIFICALRVLGKKTQIPCVLRFVVHITHTPQHVV